MKTLKDLKVNETATVVKLHGDGNYEGCRNICSQGGTVGRPNGIESARL